MAKYESLPTITISPEQTILPSHDLPELVRLDDPATSVMTDFTHTPPHVISPDKSMDEALNEMKITGVHLLLVTDAAGHLQGIISSEDVLGEKPIKLIQEKRITRENVTVQMLMIPVDSIIAFHIESIDSARVGHIVKALADHKRLYALVTGHSKASDKTLIRGLFTAAQISKQLHTDLRNAIASVGSISELQKRHEV